MDIIVQAMYVYLVINIQIVKHAKELKVIVYHV